MRLNVGCGRDTRPGYHNCDNRPLPGVDLVFDLNEPWPFPEESVDYILARHIIEHVDDPMHFMAEAHRVLTWYGEIELHHPHWRSAETWNDPTHKRAIGPMFFGFFTGNKYCEPYIDPPPPFELMRRRRPVRHVLIAGKWLPLPWPGGEVRVTLRKR